jgi:hypothetical protein
VKVAARKKSKRKGISASELQRLLRLAEPRPGQPVTARLAASIDVPEKPASQRALESIRRPDQPLAHRTTESLRSRLPAAPRQY